MLREEKHIYDNRLMRRFFIGDAQPVPVDLALVAGDCIQNARAALDHLAWQLVLGAGNTPTDKTAFPLLDSRLNGKGNRRNIFINGGVDPKALALVKWCQPYRRGAINGLLGALHDLSNIDKHRTVLLIGVSYNAIAVGGGSFVSQSFWPPGGPITFKKDAQVMTIGYKLGDPAADMQVDVELPPTVTFGEGERCEGEVVSELLQRLLDAVRGVVLPSFVRFF